jgi:hypothetical protein
MLSRAMDNDYFRVDLSELLNSIDRAEVLTLYFPLLRRTLLVDARSNESDGPMVKVVPMVSTPEERLRELEKMRPRFPQPESITFIPWPKYVDSLQRLGVMDRLMARFAGAGDSERVAACEQAFGELKEYERREILDAIRGENYETLWDGQASGAVDEEEADEDEF